MQPIDYAEELVPDALEFFRSCLCGTHLRRYSDLFSSDNEASESIREALREGTETFRPDLARWRLDIESPRDLFDRLLLAPSIQAAFFYRVSRALYLRDVDLVPDVIAALARHLTGLEIYYSADIGPGLKVIHGTGSVIGARCTIGANFTIYQNVTLGDRLGELTGTENRPVVGDHVIASAGAKILGPVVIGSRSVIGANSLIMHSVPENSVSAGVPAKVIATLNEESFQAYWQGLKG